jgi:hypothetical protein
MLIAKSGRTLSGFLGFVSYPLLLKHVFLCLVDGVLHITYDSYELYLVYLRVP